VFADGVRPGLICARTLFQYCDKTLYPRVHLGTSLLDPLAMVVAHIGMDHRDEALTHLASLRGTFHRAYGIEGGSQPATKRPEVSGFVVAEAAGAVGDGSGNLFRMSRLTHAPPLIFSWRAFLNEYRQRTTVVPTIRAKQTSMNTFPPSNHCTGEFFRSGSVKRLCQNTATAAK
jgi:hypothetical protein